MVLRYRELPLGEAARAMGIKNVRTAAGPYSLRRFGVAPNAITIAQAEGPSWRLVQRVCRATETAPEILWRRWPQALYRHLTMEYRWPRLTLTSVFNHAHLDIEAVQPFLDFCMAKGIPLYQRSTREAVLTVTQAEDVCDYLGFHPVDCWPDWWELHGEIGLRCKAARARRRRYTAKLKNRRYAAAHPEFRLHKRNYARRNYAVQGEQQRAERRDRYRTDPEWAAYKREQAAAWRAANRERQAEYRKAYYRSRGR